MVEETQSCAIALRGWRRLLVLAVAAAVALAATAVRQPTEAATAGPSTQLQAAQSDEMAQSDQANQIIALVRNGMEQYHLNAVIVRVTVDGKEVITAAFGESMTGVPASTDMHFRNGAVAISYVSTLLLILVDDGVLRLDDPLSLWMPELMNADKVTLKMLANMTSGYRDYETNEQFNKDLYINPFRQWTPEELIAIGLSEPPYFEPGTNWSYGHTNYVILGKAIERATGRSVADLMQERVLGPLGLTNTANSFTPTIPEPALHAFSSERRAALGIAPSMPFYEESSFWNPSWTITHGAIQTTNIFDMTATAVAIGEGTLLSPASHQAQVASSRRGFGAPLAGCSTCHTFDDVYTYELGVVRSGNWLLQNPLFYGYAAVEGYNPAKKIAIAVAVTYREAAFDAQGNYPNRGDTLFRKIAAVLAPDDAPPIR